jgi:hypothetical protein
LPSSYVGAGLDVSHVVVGFRRIAHLNREIEIEVHDPRLLAPVPKAAMWRLAAMAAAAMEFLRRGWGPDRVPVAVPGPELPPQIATEPEAPGASANSELQHVAINGQPIQYPNNVAVMRRYGNQ